MRGANTLTFFKFIRKADIALLIFLVALGIASLFLLPDSGVGENVVITVNGEVYGQYPLSVDKVIDVSTEYGYNKVIISDGTVRVSESDCANHECQAFGDIDTPRQTIMCLPHRLIITITGKSDVDVVVY